MSCSGFGKSSEEEGEEEDDDDDHDHDDEDDHEDDGLMTVHYPHRGCYTPLKGIPFTMVVNLPHMPWVDRMMRRWFKMDSTAPEALKLLLNSAKHFLFYLYISNYISLFIIIYIIYKYLGLSEDRSWWFIIIFPGKIAIWKYTVFHFETHFNIVPRQSQLWPHPRWCTTCRQPHSRWRAELVPKYTSGRFKFEHCLGQIQPSPTSTRV